MKIIYPQEDETVAIITVAEVEGVDLVEIGKKLVPTGVRFKVVKDTDVIDEPTYWAAWRVDFAKADGIGEA